MLTKIYIEALLVDERLADEIWEAWDAGEFSDFWVAWGWWAIVGGYPLDMRTLFKLD